jgi:phosphorylase kinase alpha/beta subunit
MDTINNKSLSKLIKPKYTLPNLEQIESLLKKQGTFSFSAFENRLFSAAILGKEEQYTGYGNVWVRDNIHIAHAHYIVNNRGIAITNVQTLMTYFKTHQERFEKIIANEADASDPMMRPHVRFNGHNLEEIQEKWSHAQNDALGYFLWFYCLLANQKSIVPLPDDLEMIARFVLYFQKIRYWEDEDSGHWEEVRKISASSIGVVVAALEQLKQFLQTSPLSDYRYGKQLITEELLDQLIKAGTTTLENILPAECIQPEPSKQRRYDAALLFLIYPLQVIKTAVADQIVQEVIDNLQGEYGIRRYLGDSYWAPDYKNKLHAEQRTIDFSDNLASRDLLLPDKGLEAQWCIFDPIISVIFGKRFQANGQEEYLTNQIKYLNRSLGQITAENDQITAFRCPELYYLEKDQYVPNDNVPLLWTQANLMVALKEIRNSLGNGSHL